LCFALNLEAVGYGVVGLDVSEAYVEELNAKKYRSHEPGVEEMLVASTQFHATTRLGKFLAADPELIFVVVATPSLPDGSYDHTQLEEVADALITEGISQRTRHFVVMCTTMPGYCDGLAERLGPYGYAVSYNPEFIAQGTVVRDQQYPDQILIGEADAAAGDAIEAVYQRVCRNEPTVCRMSRLSAEITKIATNCFLTTKISFANSIGDLARKVGAEPDKILAAIGSDGRIGARYLRYGYGYGGPCFPRDNRALALYGEQQGYELLISKATDQVNQRHLDFQVEETLAQHPENEVIELHQVTYKPGTTILEESQQLALAVRLAEVGRRVRIIEHPVVVADLKSRFGDLFEYQDRG